MRIGWRFRHGDIKRKPVFCSVKKEGWREWPAHVILYRRIGFLSGTLQKKLYVREKEQNKWLIFWIIWNGGAI